MAATPHLREDFPGVDVARARRARRRRCRRGCTQERIALELVTGGEVDVLWAQSAPATRRCAPPATAAAGTDLLVETPYGELPGMFEDLLFRIRVRGFRILLAHPERNPSFQRDPERLVRLVEGDVLVQLTAALGHRRRARRASSRARLIADGHAHVIAGDLHRAGGSRASIADAVAVGRRRARALDGHRGAGGDPRRRTRSRPRRRVARARGAAAGYDGADHAPACDVTCAELPAASRARHDHASARVAAARRR